MHWTFWQKKPAVRTNSPSRRSSRKSSSVAFYTCGYSGMEPLSIKLASCSSNWAFAYNVWTLTQASFRFITACGPGTECSWLLTEHPYSPSRTRAGVLNMNMRYYLEHHLYPNVSYYNLPALHELIKDQCPPAFNGLRPVFTEMIPVLWLQRKDPNYYIKRILPVSANALA